MNFKENVINFFSILALLRGPIVWLRGPDLARGPLIEDPCHTIKKKNATKMSRRKTLRRRRKVVAVVGGRSSLSRRKWCRCLRRKTRSIHSFTNLYSAP